MNAAEGVKDSLTRHRFRGDILAHADATHRRARECAVAAIFAGAADQDGAAVVARFERLTAQPDHGLVRSFTHWNASSERTSVLYNGRRLSVNRQA
jgi:hypothetical protein